MCARGALGNDVPTTRNSLEKRLLIRATFMPLSDEELDQDETDLVCRLDIGRGKIVTYVNQQ